MSRLLKLLVHGLTVCLSLTLLHAPVAAAEDGFLDPAQAFVLEPQMLSADVLSLRYKIATGYYMYRERFTFALDKSQIKLGEPQFPAGTLKHDPTFNKEMELYYGNLEIRLPLPAWPVGQDLTPIQLTVTGQGCATAGLCYPPMDFVVTLIAKADTSGYSIVGQPTTGVLERLYRGQWRELFFESNDFSLASVLSSTGLVEIVVLFFLLGALLALTPCVLPMVPILSVLLVGEQRHVSRWRGLMLAVAYVAGMSLVYTALGVAAGLSGAGLAAWLQTPWVLSVFALVLTVLALSMFDVFTFQMPSSVQTRLSLKNNSILGGRLGAAFLMGALSALIVGPCVAAPLAAALLYISQTGDVVLGGSALFAMAWGMGVPLLLMGASAGKLMPRLGGWMTGVKQFFGVLLFATAWWMVTPLLPSWLQIGGWAVLSLFSAVLLRAFDTVGPDMGFAGLLRKTLGMLLTLLSLIWLLGVASGGRSLLQPLLHLVPAMSLTSTEPIARNVASAPKSVPTTTGGKSTLLGSGTGAATPGTPLTESKPSGTVRALANMPAHTQFKRVHTVAELDAQLAQSTRPIMLDFYADWCVSCKEMETFTFSSPRVAQRFNQMLLLQADVTANNLDDRALLKRFKLFGPPGIIFFDANGRERKDVRVIGFQDENRFLTSLDRLSVAK